jgi:competence protein ComEC
VDLRLAVPAAAGWLSAALLIGAPALALPACVVTAALAALAVHRRAVVLAAALGAVALLAGAVAAHEDRRAPQHLVAAAEQRSVLEASIRIDERIGSGGGRSVSGVLVSYRLRGEATGGASAPLRLVGTLPQAAAGEELFAVGTLQRAEGGDSASFVFFASEVPRVVAAQPTALEVPAALRDRFRAAAGRLGGDGGALLPGLAVGDTAAVDAGLEDAMRGASLTHLTAVSGANCAVVVGIVMAVASAAGLPRLLRVLSALGALAGFVVLVTPEPSVVRAAVMGAIVLISLAGGRPFRGVPVLAAASLVLLVGDPWLARDFGFLLSVLATGALLLLAGPITDVLARWMPKPLALVLAVPLSAQLVCAPVLVLLDPSLQVYGVPANLLAGPAAPLATIAGLAACLLLPLLPGIGEALMQLAWFPAAWIAAVARVAAAAPAARVGWLPDWPGLVVLAAITALTLFAVFAAHSRRRRWASLAAAVALAITVGSAVGGPMLGRVGQPRQWQFALCDVGQGDALVVRSDGATAVVDTGADPARMSGCLDRLGIRRIDLLVLTHFDHDHVGAAGVLLGRVERVLVGPSETPADDRLVHDFRAYGAAVDQVSRGATGQLGTAGWRVLWPPARSPFEPGNESSVVLHVAPLGACAPACLRAVLLGDLGETAQEALQRAEPLGEVDVVKVSHHGSGDQSPALYQQLSATVGLVGVGDNRYGHPAHRALDMLRRSGTEVLRSDRHGLVLIGRDGAGALEIWTERTG